MLHGDFEFVLMFTNPVPASLRWLASSDLKIYLLYLHICHHLDRIS